MTHPDTVLAVYPALPAANSPGLRAGGLFWGGSMNPIRPHNAADPMPAGCGCPSGPTALVPDCGASNLAANGNASGTPFVDCLNGPGAIAPRAGAAGGAG